MAICGKHARNRGRDVDDCFQEGSIGLLRAIDKFDPSKGIRFGTYATFWVRAYVSRSTSHPSHVAGARMADASLDEVGETPGAIAARTLATADEGPEMALARRERAADVRLRLVKVAPRLGEVGQAITVDRLASDSPATLEQIGLAAGLSRERVRQIEKRVRAFLGRVLAEVVE